MKEIVIGFLGCGNVGGGVWELLQGFAPEIARRDQLSIRVKKVLVRDVNKARSCSVSPSLLTTDPEEVLCNPEISLVAEFMGGGQSATEYMLRALQNGKTVRYRQQSGGGPELAQAAGRCPGQPRGAIL